MVLSAQLLAETLRLGNKCQPNGIAVIPSPNIDDLKASGEASIELRLGRWFVSLKQNKETHISLKSTLANDDVKHSKSHFVPFGSKYVLHPNRFVLATSIEWLSFSSPFSALVVGKSSLGRRGLVIETAAGVHPGFNGCLTLELTNVGEIPLELFPGMKICQLFVHQVQGELSTTSSSYSGRRKPILGALKPDAWLTAFETK